MVQLRIVGGRQAGAAVDLKRFPCVIGRGASAGWRVEDAGVWDEHVRLDLKPGKAFTVSVLSKAIASLNGAPLQQTTVLHNGDVIECGAAKIQFWLGQTRQRNLHWRETLTWIALTALTAGQIWLIVQLLR